MAALRTLGEDRLRPVPSAVCGTTLTRRLLASLSLGAESSGLGRVRIPGLRFRHSSKEKADAA